MKAAIESEVRTMNMKVTTDYFHVRPLTLAAHSNNCQRLAKIRALSTYDFSKRSKRNLTAQTLITYFTKHVF